MVFLRGREARRAYADVEWFGVDHPMGRWLQQTSALPAVPGSYPADGGGGRGDGGGEEERAGGAQAWGLRDPIGEAYFRRARDLARGT